MKRIVLASGNPGKLAELRALLARHELELVPQAELGIAAAVEDGADLRANALLKARHAAAASGLAALADDSGLEVDCLGGRPGVHSARYAGPEATAADNSRRLLAELAGVPAARRGARFRCVLALVRSAADPEPLIAEGVWAGRIAEAPRGSGGFGYDPLFIGVTDGRTAAELPADEKNRLSHRGRALAALSVALAALAPT
ncbi:MAG: RdgB/HAM1 family non-canonical purine NTP pyrophosphatase [Gammaproteobacteria bacterium]|nr:RdgB/HAM1 family non-canonical purine NTP pyrophosphatase [Gammaproteobacteria bacterium]